MSKETFRSIMYDLMDYSGCFQKHEELNTCDIEEIEWFYRFYPK